VVTDLSDAPGQLYTSKADLLSENFTVRVACNAVGAWFELSGIKPYYRAGLWTR
jgi:hypothetical protein